MTRMCKRKTEKREKNLRNTHKYVYDRREPCFGVHYFLKTVTEHFSLLRSSIAFSFKLSNNPNRENIPLILLLKLLSPWKRLWTMSSVWGCIKPSPWTIWQHDRRAPTKVRRERYHDEDGIVCWLIFDLFFPRRSLLRQTNGKNLPAEMLFGFCEQKAALVKTYYNLRSKKIAVKRGVRIRISSNTASASRRQLL